MLQTADQMIAEIPADSNKATVQLYETFKELYRLETVTGRKEKEEILKHNKNNEIFKQIFWWAQNPYLRYNLKKVKGIEPSRTFKGTFKDSFKMFVGLLKALDQRVYTGDKANDIMAGFLNMCSSEERFWYGRVLRHNLRVGITPKTFNSIFKGYIPVFQVMLAKEDKKVKTKPKKVVLERKYDGYRVLARIQNHQARMFSRQGKPYEGFNDLIKELSYLPDGCYDGELITLDNQFSGMQKQALRKDTEKEGLLNIFDYLTLEEFDSQKCKLKLLDRKERLIEKLYRSDPDYAFGYSFIRYVENTEIVDYGDPTIEQIYTGFLDEGYEGAMMKDIEGIYTFNRSSAWLKIVPFISVDLPIIGFNEGNKDTKYENTLGALKMNYKGNELLVAGIPDELRDEIWNHQDQYLGKMIEVHARQESKNQNGNYSLRFPRFWRFRPDKDKE